MTFNVLMGLNTASFDGLDYDGREALKQEGWELYHSGATAEEQAEGALKIIRSHFHRSLETAECDKRAHPGFHEYARHWLASDDTLITGPARKILDGQYPAPAQPRIAKGKSYYF